MMRRLLLIAAVLLLSPLLTGCVIIDDPRPPVGEPKSGPIPRFELQGKWVVSAFQGTDGKTQSLDTSDPSQTITYVFDGDRLTIDWGGKGKDVATATWTSIGSDGIGKLLVHVTERAAGTGQIGTGQSGDVTYLVTPLRFTDKAIPDRVSLGANGEQLVLQRRD